MGRAVIVDRDGKPIPDQSFEDSDFGTTSEEELIRQGGAESTQRLLDLIRSRKRQGSMTRPIVDVGGLLLRVDNDALRKGEDLDLPTARDIDTIDQLLDEASLPQEMTGLRLVSQEAQKWLTERIGQSFEEQGYTSVKIGPESLRKVEGLQEVHVVLAKGIHALQISDEEVLVQRGQQFDIKQVGKWLTLFAN